MLALFTFFGLNFLTALSGGIFRPGTWYLSLAKPSWQPPGYLFGPVWTVLYCMIAISGWLVWQNGPANLNLLMLAYGLQLVLNFAWSALFFGLRRMDWALIDVTLLWLSISGLILLFWPVDRFAALLLVPYILWVSFAAFLNFIMLKLNPVVGRGGLDFG